MKMALKPHDQFFRVERLGDVQAELAGQDLVAEAVHHRGDVVLAAAGGAVGVVEVDPAGDVDAWLRVRRRRSGFCRIFTLPSGVGPERRSSGRRAGSRLRRYAG